MTELDVSLPVAAQPSLEDVVSLAEAAEDHGYDRVWLPETWGRDGVTTLALAAERTDDVGLGASILNVYSRSPTLVGQTAATLQEASDGRFRVGLGPSGPAVIRNWHGVEFDRPLKRTREYVEILRRVVSGEEVRYDGDVFRLGGFRLRQGPPEIPPPVDAAGMGPKSVELAGRFADGWHALMLTPEGLQDRLDDFRRGADLGDRDPEDARVTMSLTCYVDEDGDRAREQVRQHLCFYIGGMGTFYRDALARQGYEDTAHAVYDNWNDGDRRAAMGALGDDLLGDLAVAGTPDEARERLAEFAGIDGVDALTVGFPREADREGIRTTMEVLAP
ncbi:TIGR04024 family LLM class F420-dependent oxidoreductase [Halorarum halobium]|uniref:TIGR04024 family LLM class F420-dependent oxidoreductase n=1 Tax=Halorarum halobium TaxID=3075121 RepID=UPI0028AA2CC3|nr:TIGR04024 family LLM class F420-dependent oxidoreductase [Halobaculum sp. XH14]